MKKDKLVIPTGLYCYTRKNGKRINCPYWAMREDMPEQLNGYCHYLEKGDWELYMDEIFNIEYRDGTKVKMTGKEMYEKWGAGNSLLWDQCKECGIDNNIEEWLNEEK